MKRIELILLLSLVWAGLWALTPILRAQDGQLTLDPPISDVFPLETLPDGVHVEYPVLLNAQTILRADAVLHFIYLDPNAAAHASAAAGDSGGNARAHVGTGGVLSPIGNPESHSHASTPSGGWGSTPGSDVDGIYDDKKKDDKARKAELDNEIWKQKDLFNDALDHATELGTILVYREPSRNTTLTTPIDLPEGMLLAEVSGHVRVLALKEESRAYAGGVRPGDEIRSFNGGPPVTTLNDFMREYAAVRHHTEMTGNSNFALSIFRPSNGQSIPVQVAAPPSIPSFLNDTVPTVKGP